MFDQLKEAAIQGTRNYGVTGGPVAAVDREPLLARIDRLEHEKRELQQTFAQFAEHVTGRLNRLDATLGL